MWFLLRINLPEGSVFGGGGCVPDYDVPVTCGVDGHDEVLCILVFM